jgi:membrane protease subunit HflC
MRIFLLGLAVLLGLALASSVVMLDEREQAFITFQGDADSWLVLSGPVVQGPALVLRIPFLHRMQRFDRRLQIFESPPLSLRTREKQQVQLRYHVVWRVADPRRLAETTPGADLVRAIDRATEGQVRSGLGQYSVEELLSGQRSDLLEKIREECRTALGERGIEVVGLALRELIFPDANLPAIFARMKQERGKVAAEIRATGEGQARRIRAEAEEEALRVVSTARSEASRMRGEGDARSAEIYAQSYGQDEEFYLFVRSLEAYEKALDLKTTIVLSPSSPFLRYLSSGDALQAPAAAVRGAPAQGFGAEAGTPGGPLPASTPSNPPEAVTPSKRPEAGTPRTRPEAATPRIR